MQQQGASLGEVPARKRASGIHCVDYGETAPSMTGAKGEKPVTRSEAEIRDRAGRVTDGAAVGEKFV